MIGHHKKAKGAYSKFLNTTEWDFYNEVSKYIDYDIDVFYHDPNIKGYSTRIKNTAKKLDGFDLVIEAHFNSATPIANGVETLYYFNSTKGKEYAKLFSDVVHDNTGITLRNGGLKALVQPKDRGYWAVFTPKPPTILIEPFFGSNRADCLAIGDAKNMACIIDDFLNRLA